MVVWCAITLLGLAPTASASTAPLVAASSRTHVWVVVPFQARAGDPVRYQLVHHADGMPEGRYRVAAEYGEEPEAIAAWENTVWVVFRPGSATGGRRQVISFRAEQNPVLGHFYNSPPLHPELLPSLPGDSLLRDFIGARRGPVALFSVATPVSRERVEIVPQRASLLQLRDGAWSEWPAPPTEVVGTTAFVAAPDGDGPELLLVSTAGGAVMVHAFAEFSGWEAWPADGLAGRPLALIGVMGRGAVVLGEEKTLSLAYLRPRGPLEFGRVAQPPARWAILGFGIGAALVELTSERVLRWRLIDGTSGEAGPWETLTPARPERDRWLHVPILGILIVSAVMLLLMFRGDAVAEPVFPDTLVIPMALPARCAALVIDYLPAAGFTLLVTGCDVQDLIALPIWTVRFEVAMAPLIALGLTSLHASVTEGLTGVSLGKLLAGGKVVRVDGTPAGLARCLARGALKFLVLAMPVIGIFCVMNINRRGMPEIATGTIVVQSRTPQPVNEPADTES